MTDKIPANGKIINSEAKWMEPFFILVSHFLSFHPRIWADAGRLELGQGQNILITS